MVVSACIILSLKLGHNAAAHKATAEEESALEETESLIEPA